MPDSKPESMTTGSDGKARTVVLGQARLTGPETEAYKQLAVDLLAIDTRLPSLRRQALIPVQGPGFVEFAKGLG